MSAGAREVYLIDEPMAAAIGAGIDIREPRGNIVVDIGGGTTEIGVISLGGLVYSKSIRIAGDEMDGAVMEYLRKTYNLLIGERTAEEIKIRIGSAYPLEEELTMDVRGRDLIAGLPKTITITSEEVREALQVRDAVKRKSVRDLRPRERRDAVGRGEPDAVAGIHLDVGGDGPVGKIQARHGVIDQYGRPGRAGRQPARSTADRSGTRRSRR